MSSPLPLRIFLVFLNPFMTNSSHMPMKNALLCFMWRYLESTFILSIVCEIWLPEDKPWPVRRYPVPIAPLYIQSLTESPSLILRSQSSYRDRPWTKPPDCKYVFSTSSYLGAYFCDGQRENKSFLILTMSRRSLSRWYLGYYCVHLLCGYLKKQ